MPPRLIIHPRAALQEGRQRDGRMIHQALANTWQGHAHRNAQIAQMPHGANARSQQMRGRMNGAAGQDDFAPHEALFLPAHQSHHANAALVFEDQLLHLGFAGNRQIFPRAGVAVQIAHGGRHALFFGIGNGDREIAIFEKPVLVFQGLEASSRERFCRGLGVVIPFLGLDAAHFDAPILAVEGPVVIKVVLNLLEIRQHRIPIPALRTARFPFIVIRGRAAIGHLAIDGRTAAQNPRLFVFAQRRAFLRVVVGNDLRMHAQFGPMKARVEIRRAWVAVADFLRFLTGRRIRPRLTQQHLMAAAGGKPMRQHGTGRTAAHNNGIEYHAALPLVLFKLGVSSGQVAGHHRYAHENAALPARPARPYSSARDSHQLPAPKPSPPGPRRARSR